MPFLSCLLALVCSTADGGETRSRTARVTLATPVVALRIANTAKLSQGGYLAWAGPAVCDPNGSVFFLVIPQPAGGGTPGRAPARQAQFNPRDVLRVSADGKERATFSPAASPKFADADDVTTLAVAVDRDGVLYMLVWATWGEKSAQYISSFDHKGKHRSDLEVDSQQILVHQFEVFGSGEFLLRGRRTDTDEARLVVLSPEGILRDVVDHPTALLKEPSPARAGAFEYMVRGDDGRIYVTQPGGRQEGDVVYVLDALGQSTRAFKLAAMPNSRRLSMWQAAGDRLAATYLEESRSSEAASGGHTGRWWIVVYGDVAGRARPQTIYGPAPGPPLCYQYEASRDTFTFLKDGASLVKMTP